jgi:hypothetical protein
MRRPTGFGNTSTISGTSDIHTNGGFVPTANTANKTRSRRGASLMLKQDSIAEESISREPSPCPPHNSTNHTTTTNLPLATPHSRHASNGSQISEYVPQVIFGSFWGNYLDINDCNFILINDLDLF